MSLELSCEVKKRKKLEPTIRQTQVASADPNAERRAHVNEGRDRCSTRVMSMLLFCCRGHRRRLGGLSSERQAQEVLDQIALLAWCEIQVHTGVVMVDHGG